MAPVSSSTQNHVEARVLIPTYTCPPASSGPIFAAMVALAASSDLENGFVGASIQFQCSGKPHIIANFGAGHPTPLVVSPGDRVEMEVSTPAAPPAPGDELRMTIDDLTTGTAEHYNRNGGGGAYTQAVVGMLNSGLGSYLVFNKLSWTAVTVNGNPLGTPGPQGTNLARPSGEVIAYTSPLTPSGSSFANSFRKF